jgi:hypothetical protein
MKRNTFSLVHRPRASINMNLAAKAVAFMNGRDLRAARRH